MPFSLLLLSLTLLWKIYAFFQFALSRRVTFIFFETMFTQNIKYFIFKIFAICCFAFLFTTWVIAWIYKIINIFVSHQIQNFIQILFVFLFVQNKQSEKLQYSLTDISSHFKHIFLIDSSSSVNSKWTFNRIAEMEAKFRIKDGSSTILFLGRYLISALRQAEINILLTD
jgi:hypothetical protein